MKNNKLFFCVIALACVCFVTCENPIMEKWWVEKEPEYIPITKMVPQVTYETVVEQEFIYRDIFIQLPPEIIHDTIIQEVEKDVPVYIYQTVVEKVPEIVIEKVPEYIYETVIEKVPEYIYETVIQTVIQEVPVYVYQTIVEKEIEERTIYEIVYQTVYETVHDTVMRDPTEDEIKDYIKDNPKEIIELIKDDPDFKDIIKEYIKENPAEVIEIIKQDPNWKDILKEIIKEIPPEDLVTYLTDEQIKYIIQQQPPQIILQTLNIIDIEYIIFAGSTSKYNGPHEAGANTDLTPQETSSNNASVAAIAKALKDNPDYLIMLHGHANPTAFSDAEIGDLMKLSEDRAKAVEAELRTQFKAINSGVDIEDKRVSVSGYGGEKVLFGQNSAYTALNRRVEMILVWVGVK